GRAIPATTTDERPNDHAQQPGPPRDIVRRKTVNGPGLLQQRLVRGGAGRPCSQPARNWGWPGSPWLLFYPWHSVPMPVRFLVLRALAPPPLLRLGWGAFSAHPLVTAACRVRRGRVGSRLDG